MHVRWVFEGLCDSYNTEWLFSNPTQLLLPQILHNMALAEAQLGNWEKAQDNLVKALDLKTEAKLSLIDRALQSTLVGGQNVVKHLNSTHYNYHSIQF